MKLTTTANKNSSIPKNRISSDASAAVTDVNADLPNDLMELNLQYSVPSPAAVTKKFVDPIKILPKTFPPPKEELENYIKVANVGEILSLVHSQGKLMDGINLFTILQRLEHIYRYQKYIGNQESFIKALNGRPEFQLFCVYLARRSNMYGPKMAFDALRIFQMLGVDSTHPASEILLQLMKYHINDLSPAEVIELGHVMSLWTKTKQTEILLKGAALWLRENLDFQHVQYLNKTEALTLLNVFGDVIDLGVIHWIAMNVYNNDFRLSYGEMGYFYEGLIKLNYEHAVIKEHCVMTIIKGVEYLTCKQVESLLDAYIMADYEYLISLDHYFITHLVSAYLSMDTTPDQDVNVISKLVKLSYTEDAIISKLCTVILDDNKDLLKDISVILDIIRMIGDVGHLIPDNYKHDVSLFVSTTIQELWKTLSVCKFIFI